MAHVAGPGVRGQAAFPGGGDGSRGQGFRVRQRAAPEVRVPDACTSMAAVCVIRCCNMGYALATCESQQKVEAADICAAVKRAK